MSNPTGPFPSNRITVAGIGASAGGIEALCQLFEAVPADLGVAYVVVVHLAPHHESELAPILARRTKMRVTEVRGDRQFARRREGTRASHALRMAPLRWSSVQAGASAHARLVDQQGTPSVLLDAKHQVLHYSSRSAPSCGAVWRSSKSRISPGAANR